MTNFLLFPLGVLIGVLFHAFLATGINEQTGYTKGRESVLNSTVYVGGGDKPCSVAIPLSVLAKMVEVGVMDWHLICKGGI